jgi:hypothetical protein
LTRRQAERGPWLRIVRKILRKLINPLPVQRRQLTP